MTASTDREKSRNGWATATPSILWTACLFWTKKVSAPCSILPGSNAKKFFSGMSACRNTWNVEDVAAGDKLVREYETTFINGGLRLKPLKTNNGVMFIRSLYLSPLEDVIDMVQFYERTTPQGGSYIVAKAGFLTAAVIMPYAISKKFADELEELSYQCRHFLNTRSAFTTPAAEDEEEPDENQTTTFDAEAAEDTE